MYEVQEFKVMACEQENARANNEKYESREVQRLEDRSNADERALVERVALQKECQDGFRKARYCVYR